MAACVRYAFTLAVTTESTPPLHHDWPFQLLLMAKQRLQGTFAHRPAMPKHPTTLVHKVLLKDGTGQADTVFRSTFSVLPPTQTCAHTHTHTKVMQITKAGKGREVCLKGRATTASQIAEAGNHVSKSGQRKRRNLQGRATMRQRAGNERVTEPVWAAR